MAKPKHGRWNGSSRQSSPSSDLHPDHPHRHPREHAFSRSLPRSPSPAILAALAIIATTSPVVAGSPVPLPTPPPTFLCPFIERDNIDPSSDIFITPPPTATPSSSTSSPTPTLQPLAKRLVIADRYVEDSDGLWQKTNQWTLYGSTVSPALTWQPFLPFQLVLPVLLKLDDSEHFLHTIATKFISVAHAHFHLHLR